MVLEVLSSLKTPNFYHCWVQNWYNIKVLSRYIKINYISHIYIPPLLNFWACHNFIKRDVNVKFLKIVLNKFQLILNYFLKLFYCTRSKSNIQYLTYWINYHDHFPWILLTLSWKPDTPSSSNYNNFILFMFRPLPVHNIMCVNISQNASKLPINKTTYIKYQSTQFRKTPVYIFFSTYYCYPAQIFWSLKGNKNKT